MTNSQIALATSLELLSARPGIEADYFEAVRFRNENIAEKLRLNTASHDTTAEWLLFQPDYNRAMDRPAIVKAILDRIDREIPLREKSERDEVKRLQDAIDLAKKREEYAAYRPPPPFIGGSGPPPGSVSASFVSAFTGGQTTGYVQSRADGPVLSMDLFGWFKKNGKVDFMKVGLVAAGLSGLGTIIYFIFKKRKGGKRG